MIKNIMGGIGIELETLNKSERPELYFCRPKQGLSCCLKNITINYGTANGYNAYVHIAVDLELSLGNRKRLSKFHLASVELSYSEAQGGYGVKAIEWDWRDADTCPAPPEHSVPTSDSLYGTNTEGYW
jgi:hypothetical protein